MPLIETEVNDQFTVGFGGINLKSNYRSSAGNLQLYVVLHCEPTFAKVAPWLNQNPCPRRLPAKKITPEMPVWIESMECEPAEALICANIFTQSQTFIIAVAERSHSSVHALAVSLVHASNSSFWSTAMIACRKIKLQKRYVSAHFNNDIISLVDDACYALVVTFTEAVHNHILGMIRRKR